MCARTIPMNECIFFRGKVEVPMTILYEQSSSPAGRVYQVDVNGTRHRMLCNCVLKPLQNVIFRGQWRREDGFKGFIADGIEFEKKAA